MSSIQSRDRREFKSDILLTTLTLDIKTGQKSMKNGTNHLILLQLFPKLKGFFFCDFENVHKSCETKFRSNNIDIVQHSYYTPKNFKHSVINLYTYLLKFFTKIIVGKKITCF